MGLARFSIADTSETLLKAAINPLQKLSGLGGLVDLIALETVWEESLRGENYHGQNSR